MSKKAKSKESSKESAKESSKESAKEPRPYINPYVGGVLLGVVLFLAFYITGNGLGASGAVAHVVAAVLGTVAPDHTDHVAYFAKLVGGHKSPLSDASVAMLVGTVVGGALSGIINRRFKVELRKGPNVTNALRLAMALLGGGIMGYGARLARGCTSGQALSGGAVLSVGSFAFMFAVFGGAYALAYFVRKLWL
jgi:uncharacterized protein